MAEKNKCFFCARCFRNSIIEWYGIKMCEKCFDRIMFTGKPYCGKHRKRKEYLKDILLMVKEQ